MPNTKEVEQKISDYKKQIQELQSMLMTERRRNCKAIPPLEQSENKEEYEQLKKAFCDLLIQYSPKNKICRNAWMITAGLQERK